MQTFLEGNETRSVHQGANGTETTLQTIRLSDAEGAGDRVVVAAGGGSVNVSVPTTVLQQAGGGGIVLVTSFNESARAGMAARRQLLTPPVSFRLLTATGEEMTGSFSEPLGVRLQSEKDHLRLGTARPEGRQSDWFIRNFRFLGGGFREIC